jgi:hypothetical protein
MYNFSHNQLNMFGISVLALPPKKTSNTRCPGRSQRNGGSRSGRLCSGPFGQELKRVMGSGKLSWSSWKINYNIRNMVKPKLYILKKQNHHKWGFGLPSPNGRLIYRFMAWLPTWTRQHWLQVMFRGSPAYSSAGRGGGKSHSLGPGLSLRHLRSGLSQHGAISAHRLMAIYIYHMLLRRENDHQISLMNRGILRNNVLIINK